MKADTFSYATLSNVKLIEGLYESYRENPISVDASWHHFFEGIEFVTNGKGVGTAIASADVRVYTLIHAYRRYGHLYCKCNPIRTHALELPQPLTLKALGFREDELRTHFPTYALLAAPRAPLAEIIEVLQTIYCGNIGVEYIGTHNPELEMWLQEQIEPTRFRPTFSIEQKKTLLGDLNRSELFEAFLQSKYVGQKRFSLEGGETLIPILTTLIDTGARYGTEEFVIGMPHRGRLNVLATILNKSHSVIFHEFEEGYAPHSAGNSGDVRYHKGFSSEVKTNSGYKVHVSLTPNPSHLSSVNPVVQGRVRAKQSLAVDDQERRKIVPVIVHGDAAIAGQGVVYETMQLGGLPGYTVGGTLHVVINNQIGFTTLPKDGRSTRYCTAIARTFASPVFHINAEDPEGCMYAAYLAVELRMRFKCDVFIELNCYRKYGHNESDEPAFTQPLEYQLIGKKRPIREIYRDNLISQGVVEKQVAESLEEEFKKSLHQALEGTKLIEKAPPDDMLEGVWKNYRVATEQDIFAATPTAVPAETLQMLTERFCAIPEGFQIHSKLQRVLNDRLSMAVIKPPAKKPDKKIDWAMAEHLAFSTLLWEGVHVRLSGQDCQRGTFSQRHAMWMDQVKERSYFPLNHLSPTQGRFEVFNSSLSEFAVLGFEFGYTLSYPQSLVMWEAQFGDFCNGGQVIIDQYISTSEQKWMRMSGLVMLLPHGYEGQGPEHSSGRMERFLILAGENNMQIVNATTPGQFFHVLRRQVLRPIRKPLIVFTPKGLLRHPKCISDIDELSKGSFEEVLDDPEAPKKVDRLLICNGHVYYDLIEERLKRKAEDVAIIRLEQLYPLHLEKLQKILDKYKGFSKCIWVQEEPSNMGAWNFIRPHLRRLLGLKVEPTYAGRTPSASPAAGSYAVHKQQLASLLNQAFN